MPTITEGGKLITAIEMQGLVEPHQSKKRDLKIQEENHIDAEYFSCKTFMELINQHGDRCVGFRVYYGNRLEDHTKSKLVVGKGKSTSRLVIIPVDIDGKDILTVNSTGSTSKSAPLIAMAGGPVCPPMCGN